MDTITLVSYDQGLGELVRWILAYGNITFIDHRVGRNKWLQSMKAIQDGGIYGGPLPLLLVNLDVISDHVALARYLAQLADLVPQDSFHAAQCDSVALDLYEMIITVCRSLYSPEEHVQATYQQMNQEVMQPLLTTINRHLNGKEWYSSDKVSWADLFIGHVFKEMMKKKPEVLDDFPNVSNLVERVLELPIIRKSTVKDARV